MSFKGPGKKVITTSLINAHDMYIEILDNFLIQSIENWFDHNEVISQDYNASCHRAKGIKAFLPERHIKSMI